MIEVRSLRKAFRVPVREAGLLAALGSVFRRRYRTVVAVDDVSLSIERGERVGFLGPNGAGKTTTLKMLAGLLHPTSGTLTVDGHEPSRREPDYLRKIMLVLGQKQQLLWDLPPTDTFDLNAAIFDVPRDQYVKTLDELVELLDLGDVVKKPTRQLSLGERMKCELVAALIHRPKVLFLDEPTLGLDVTMQATLRAFVRRYNEQEGATLLLTSHYMEDVTALCPRVIVVDRGRVTYDGSREELARQVRPVKRVTLRLARAATAEEVQAALGDGVRVVTHDAAELSVEVDRANVGECVSRALSRLPVTDISVEDPPLEEIMRELFRETSAARLEADADAAARADADAEGAPDSGEEA